MVVVTDGPSALADAERAALAAEGIPLREERVQLAIVAAAKARAPRSPSTRACERPPGWPGRDAGGTPGAMASELSTRHCVPSRRGMPALDGTAVARLLAQLPGWSVRDGVLTQTFRFPGFADAIAFVNAVAEIAEAEDHHPDLTIRYDRVEVSTSTHVADGLTENDFILAARIGEVIARQPAPGPTGNIERRRPDSNR